MAFSLIRNFFAAAPHIERLPDEEIKHQYPRYRWRIMESTFLGYGTFYLVRNNLGAVALDIESALHYTHSMIGSILAITGIAYGLGKFLMGSVSDRCDARKFMAFGLLLTALCNFAFGSVAIYSVHLMLWALNGFIQGMGWPPCGRCMGHWYSVRERGLKFSIWNTSHNVGGGIAGILAVYAVRNFGWQYAFYFPGIIALVGAVYLFWRLRDTPQSVGLPPIEEYRNDYTEDEEQHGTQERELSTKELFVSNVLKNKYIWILALANFFAYITRYFPLDWGPTYLREVKGASIEEGGAAIMAIEFGGIPSTIALGWLSDKLAGRRGMVATVCMIPILGAFLGIIMTPIGHLGLDLALLFIVGFFIYPVINLIVIAALDFTSKKAIGTAAGFIGLFGYLGKSCGAKASGWIVDHYEPIYGLEAAWNIVIYGVIGCGAIAVGLLAITWQQRPRA
jgi:MFS transporter, OPA family, glycerol-3-phosphate transporter